MIKKILLSVFTLAALGLGGFFITEHFLDSKPERSDSPENITADYRDLLAKAEKLKSSAGVDCADNKSIRRQIESLEKELANLEAKKKEWLDNVPELPEINPEIIGSDNPLGRPGSEMPELTSDVPPLPDIDPKSIIIKEVPGSQVPELSSDVPPLPDIDPIVIDSEFIPELPEINTGRPGSEIPELTSDVPPLPDINEADIINPDEYFYQMEQYGQKISGILKELKTLCQEKEVPAKKKVVSDKCSDACKRHKDCAAYTEDVTPTDLDDAYNTCMEECAAWPKEMIKCINAIDIKIPNDCVSFVNCRLPQYYEEKYLE